MILNFIKGQDHPLVQKLCLAPTRLATIEVDSHTPFSIEVLARSVERGTLRGFTTYDYIYLTDEILAILLKFVASVQMTRFEFNIKRKSPISYKTFLEGVIDAFLSRERAKRFQFCVDPRTEKLCERLREVVEQNKVNIEYRQISVSRIGVYICNQ
uniref:NAD(P)-bd_dom domain-containing protein n=1 Tax=Steinernema glaseri TaxID=37863 RepID=A0A1I7ZWV7_9BILA